MNKSIKNVLAAIALVAVVTLMSSCNRGGYGCPYELSLPSVSICK